MGWCILIIKKTKLLPLKTVQSSIYILILVFLQNLYIFNSLICIYEYFEILSVLLINMLSLKFDKCFWLLFNPLSIGVFQFLIAIACKQTNCEVRENFFEFKMKLMMMGIESY